jgi:hypothetical protein
MVKAKRIQTSLFRFSMCAIVVAGLALSAILYPFSGIHYNVDLAAGVEIAFKKNFFPKLSKRNMSDYVYPCPCGWFNDTQKACGCAPAVVTKYQKRISGPMLDRIDIHIEVPRVDYENLSGDQ